MLEATGKDARRLKFWVLGRCLTCSNIRLKGKSCSCPHPDAPDLDATLAAFEKLSSPGASSAFSANSADHFAVSSAGGPAASGHLSAPAGVAAAASSRHPSVDLVASQGEHLPPLLEVESSGSTALAGQAADVASKVCPGPLR